MAFKEVIVNGEKYCPTCNKIVPVNKFYPSKKANRDYSVNCMDCHDKYQSTVDGYYELYPTKAVLV